MQNSINTHSYIWHRLKYRTWHFENSYCFYCDVSRIIKPQGRWCLTKCFVTNDSHQRHFLSWDWWIFLLQRGSILASPWITILQAYYGLELPNNGIHLSLDKLYGLKFLYIQSHTLRYWVIIANVNWPLHLYEINGMYSSQLRICIRPCS